MVLQRQAIALILIGIFISACGLKKRNEEAPVPPSHDEPELRASVLPLEKPNSYFIKLEWNDGAGAYSVKRIDKKTKDTVTGVLERGTNEFVDDN